MNYNSIQKHMKNKFNGTDKFIQYKNTPTKSQLDEMADNQVIKCPILAIAVDLVDFTNLSKYSDPEILNLVMSEYVWGVTKIMKDYGVIQIDIQGDGIYGIMPSAAFRKDMDDIFSLACMLNSFEKHMKKNINIFFTSNDFKKSSYPYNSNNPGDNFEFGIGLWLSDDNYVTKAGHASTRDLIFMGDSVNYANTLAKKANRNNLMNIVMNNYLYQNFTGAKKQSIANAGGIISVHINSVEEKLWHCDWIVANYDNFIYNSV